MLLNRIFRTVRLPSAAGTSISNNETTTSTTVGAFSSDAGQAPIGQSFTYNLQESVDDVSWSDVSGYTGLPSPLANISTIRTLGNYYRFQVYLGSDVVMTAASAQLTEYYITGWSEVASFSTSLSVSNGSANTIDFVLIGPGGNAGDPSSVGGDLYSGGGGGGGGHFAGTYTHTPGDEFIFQLISDYVYFRVQPSSFGDYIEASRGLDAVFATPGTGGTVTGSGIFSTLSSFGTATTGKTGGPGVLFDGISAPGGAGGEPGIVTGSLTYPFAGYGQGAPGINISGPGPADPGEGYVKYRFRLKL